MRFKNSSKLRNLIWRAFGARISFAIFETLGTITPVYVELGTQLTTTRIDNVVTRWILPLAICYGVKYTVARRRITRVIRLPNLLVVS